MTDWPRGYHTSKADAALERLAEERAKVCPCGKAAGGVCTYPSCMPAAPAATATPPLTQREAELERQLAEARARADQAEARADRAEQVAEERRDRAKRAEDERDQLRAALTKAEGALVAVREALVGSGNTPVMAAVLAAREAGEHIVAERDRVRAVERDVQTRLAGYDDSKIDGDDGLVQAVINELVHRENEARGHLAAVVEAARVCSEKHNGLCVIVAADEWDALDAALSAAAPAADAYRTQVRREAGLLVATAVRDAAMQDIADGRAHVEGDVLGPHADLGAIVDRALAVRPA